MLQEHGVFWDVGVIKAFLHEATADRGMLLSSVMLKLQLYPAAGKQPHSELENHHVEWENQRFRLDHFQ